MADLRNFRSSYLEKVGIKGVEEKKSLAILLKEQNLDIDKLVQFCLRFPVPTIYRPYLWKILLGVLPRQQGSCQDVVMRHRQEQYNLMYEALEVMHRLQVDPAMVHLSMYLLQEGTLPFNHDMLACDEENKIFLAVCRAVAKMIDEPIDIYWVCTRFFKLRDRFKDVIPIMIERIDHYVQREDSSNSQLTQCLHSLNAYSHLPFDQWFNACYAGVLPDLSLVRIWDKLIGGSIMVLVYIAVAILLTLKRPIMSMRNIQDIQHCLAQIVNESDDSGDIIVSKGIELWQKHGSPLGVTRADSPIVSEKLYT